MNVVKEKWCSKRNLPAPHITATTNILPFLRTCAHNRASKDKKLIKGVYGKRKQCRTLVQIIHKKGENKNKNKLPF